MLEDMGTICGLIRKTLIIYSEECVQSKKKLPLECVCVPLCVCMCVTVSVNVYASVCVYVCVYKCVCICECM